jgi:uncharacterized membrane protein YfcA
MDQKEVVEMIEAEETVVSTEVIASSRKNVNRYFIGAFLFILAGVIIYILTPKGEIEILKNFLIKDNHLFFWMVFVGFAAEIVAGSMGMGYGVICTTILLILNVPPPLISASIHSAESFTSATGAVSHYKLGNVNKKLTKHLAVPAVIGAVIGAIALTYVGEKYAKLTKPFIATYTLYLGIRILQNAFRKKEVIVYQDGPRNQKKRINITLLGLIGGFIDSFGGGGWGPLVTGTFIKNGRTPRYVIGSSTVAKFILTFASAVTFIFTVGIHHWNIVAGLLLGGIVTAPFSAMLTTKLPVKKMFVAVGVVVIICSLISFYRAVFL